MKLSTRPIHGSSKIRFTHNRRGFLLVDAFAGAGLAVFALSMMVWVMSADVRIRKAQEQRMILLQASQNLIERLETLPFDALDQKTADSVASGLLRVTQWPDLHFKVTISKESGTQQFKRVQVTGQVGSSDTLIIKLWRDRYQPAKKS
jgi:hypothetical protein